MVETSTFISDLLNFIKTDIAENVNDPVSASRGKSSKFVMTSFPEREVKYPLITIKLVNYDAVRAGMQTTAMNINAILEIRVWARNQKEKDEIAHKTYDRLRKIQFTADGSTQNSIHDFTLLSSLELDESGRNPKSRIMQIQYKFFDIQ